MTLPVVLSLVLAVLAAAHAWWAMGRIWPAASEPDAGARRDRRRAQPHAAALAVRRRRAGAAGRRGLAVGGRAPGRDSQLVLIGSIVIGAVFFIRGTAGYSPRWRARFTAEPFRTRDFYLYSPLCLALGVGFIALLTREMH